MQRGGHRSGNGRKPGFTHSEQTRERIRTTKLLNRLQSFVLGELKKPMQPSQVTATLGLLAKTLPDLKSIEHSGTIVEDVHAVSAEPLSEEQWAEIYGGSRRN
jgi:hypothetical protein